ncbi:MAG: rhodanese-like domain-containing protein [Muribaculum sp.]|nr:rhodanese-like domain-containing protein [Muribaculaceae bacterium]MCM1081073.1 rhodanese-like domain-containing protein [Muribaculum sp.]
MKIKTIFTFVIGLIMTGCSAKASNTSVEVISPKEFQSKLNADPDALLLDVRKPDEYAAGHLKGAHLLNWLDTDGFKHDAKKLDKSKTIYVYCRSGRRSNEASRYLAEKGYKVVDMDGGILAWNENNLPVVIETSSMP